MKYSAIPAFEKHLHSAKPDHFSDLYFIIAKDNAQRKDAVDSLLNTLSASHKDISIKMFNSDGCNLSALKNEIFTFSLFLSKTALLIHDVDKGIKTLLPTLEAYLRRPTNGIILILTASSLSPNSLLYRHCDVQGVILELPELKPWEKERHCLAWVAHRVQQEGKQIDPQACQMLVKQIGSDIALLQQEILKLCCYIGDRISIGVDDLLQLTECANVDNVWQLGEVIFKRDAPAAWRTISGLLNDGASLVSILRQLRQQFVTDYQVAALLHDDDSTQKIQQQFPYMKGRVLDKHIQQARHYGLSAFKRGILAIDDAELRAKNSQGSDILLAQMLVTSLTQAT